MTAWLSTRNDYLIKSTSDVPHDVLVVVESPHPMSMPAYTRCMTGCQILRLRLLLHLRYRLVLLPWNEALKKAHWGAQEAVAVSIDSDSGQGGSGRVAEGQCSVAERNDEQRTAVAGADAGAVAGAVLQHAAAVPHLRPPAGLVLHQDVLKAAERGAGQGLLAAHELEQLLVQNQPDVHSLIEPHFAICLVWVGGLRRGRKVQRAGQVVLVHTVAVLPLPMDPVRLEGLCVSRHRQPCDMGMLRRLHLRVQAVVVQSV